MSCSSTVGWDYFHTIVVVDFEFQQPAGERPIPHCLVAHDIITKTTTRTWLADEPVPATPPYGYGQRDLVVAYNAVAELSCHLALGWPLPVRVLDLYVEFLNVVNGVPVLHGKGLIGACHYFGLSTMDAEEKASMRELAIRGGPFNPEERDALLAYCEGDVRATAALFTAMKDTIDLPRAVLRGRYTAAAARMEYSGVPIDVGALTYLSEHWDELKNGLVARVDRDFGVYDGLSFKRDRFARWLIDHGIPWPTSERGTLKLDDDTFKAMAGAYPVLESLRQLRASLARLRLQSIRVGADGRNRASLRYFRSKTSRNQPSNVEFIFGPHVWLRGLIAPPPGQAIAYIDWSAQEFAIAAVLAGDGNMVEAYTSGDPYMRFAVLAGAAPEGATKQTHGAVRDRYKACALGVSYGMGWQSLAERADLMPFLARDLLRQHRAVFPRYWAWAELRVIEAMLRGHTRTLFGWTLSLFGEEVPNTRSLQNFPVQANAAEMMRLAAIYGTEAGVEVCAPVHDAFLIAAPTDHIDHAVAVMQAAMAKASRIVLDGFEVRTDVNIVRHPDRYSDPRGVEMWRNVWQVAAEVTAGLAPVNVAVDAPHADGVDEVVDGAGRTLRTNHPVSNV